ncbi:MAG: hypothetical protein J6D00_05315 [Christensenellaceae bacterium]|nr:hypothetical protein [Christensenellaceae bacterium]
MQVLSGACNPFRFRIFSFPICNSAEITARPASHSLSFVIRELQQRSVKIITFLHHARISDGFAQQNRCPSGFIQPFFRDSGIAGGFAKQNCSSAPPKSLLPNIMRKFRMVLRSKIASRLASHSLSFVIRELRVFLRSKIAAALRCKTRKTENAKLVLHYCQADSAGGL